MNARRYRAGALPSRDYTEVDLRWRSWWDGANRRSNASASVHDGKFDEALPETIPLADRGATPAWRPLKASSYLGRPRQIHRLLRAAYPAARITSLHRDIGNGALWLDLLDYWDSHMIAFFRTARLHYVAADLYRSCKPNTSADIFVFVGVSNTGKFWRRPAK